MPVTGSEAIPEVACGMTSRLADRLAITDSAVQAKTIRPNR